MLCYSEIFGWDVEADRREQQAAVECPRKSEKLFISYKHTAMDNQMTMVPINLALATLFEEKPNTMTLVVDASLSIPSLLLEMHALALDLRRNCFLTNENMDTWKRHLSGLLTLMSLVSLRVVFSSKLFHGIHPYKQGSELFLQNQ